VDTLVKMSLNWMTSKRLISIQEAVHEIDRLSLIICSDEINYVPLASCMKLRKSTERKPNDLVNSYANRDIKYEHYSLDRYFYEVFVKESFMKDEDSGREKDRILIANGLNCRPCHPIDFNYARGMLIMHKPWSSRKPLDTRDKLATINTFKMMLEEKKVPVNVWTQYMRAVKYAQEKRIELIAKQGVLDADVELDELDHYDAEQYLQWKNSTFFDDGRNGEDTLKGEKVDRGIDHDWSISSFAGVRDVMVDGDMYTQQLRDDCNQLEITNANNLAIPLMADGSKYSVDILSDEQKIIVLAVIDTVVKFLTNDDEYEPLRATVVGCGGCGKSLIINTIITIIRELTNCNSSVKVAAPSGSAAYNVGGCTLHRLLDINVNVPWYSLSEMKRSKLTEKLSELLVFMIDERSMLNSQVVFGAEEHARECVYNGHNARERWGGIPAVLFFGDDYQLPPPDRLGGVINGFTKYYCNKSPKVTSYRSKNAQICDYEGVKILTEMMTQKVFMLTKNFRASKPEDDELMSRLRVGEPTKEDAIRLMDLHLDNYSDDFIEELEQDPRCLWAFAKRDDMKKKNIEMLVKTHKSNNSPVARLSCVFDSSHPGSSAYTSHFFHKNIIYNLDICVGAQVCLETANIEPNAGLFVGAIGRVVEIVYDKSVGPNGERRDHLPRYVVVDIPSFRPPEGVPVWDKNHPTVSAISNEYIVFNIHCPKIDCLTTEYSTLNHTYRHCHWGTACPNNPICTQMR